MPLYNTRNQYQSIPGFSNPGPTYDANGDVLTDSFHTYTWDAEGHVTAIDSIGLTYDALGRQVEQNQSGTYFQIVYSPMGTKLAVMKGQTIQQAFVPLPGGTTAEYLSWGLSHYRHPDWLGSERLESSTTHAILQDTAYAPFGEPYAELSGGNGEISFTGQNKDTDWLNFDFMYREYDPRQSRWISPDPAGSHAADPSDPQSWNRYAYVMNNPLSFTDPLGLDCGDGDYVTTESDESVTVHSTPCPDQNFFGNNARLVGFFGHKLVKILRKIGNYIPIPCGAGVFNYGGVRVSGDVASVSVNKIRMADTRSGYSEAPFADISFGEGLMAGYGQAVFNSGEKEHFLFGGVGGDIGVTKASVSAFASHVSDSSVFQNSIGLNGDAGFSVLAGGVGAYVNTDSLTSCMDHGGN